jgi:hypothetical protein
VLHPGRVGRRPPSSFVILRKLEVVALAVDSHGDVADAGPGVGASPQCPERAVVRGHREPGEADSSTQELAALVEHALLDDLVRPPEHRRRDRQAERLGGLEVNHQIEPFGPFYRQFTRLGAL